MTKTELISAMAAECSLSKTDAGKALDAFMHQVTVALPPVRRSFLPALVYSR